MTVVSAHRTPQRMFDYAREAEGRGCESSSPVSGAAHLPGMVASLCVLPVIGVPISATKLDGEDALLYRPNASGIPATVAIDNSANAGLLAAQILATSDDALRERLHEYRRSLEALVLEKAARVEQQQDDG